MQFCDLPRDPHTPTWSNATIQFEYNLLIFNWARHTQTFHSSMPLLYPYFQNTALFELNKPFMVEKQLKKLYIKQLNKTTEKLYIKHILNKSCM